MIYFYTIGEFREKKINGHAFTHGKTAYENATKIFELNEIEKDMID